MADSYQRDELFRQCFFIADPFFVYHFAEELCVLVCHFRDCQELPALIETLPFDVESFWFKGLKEGLNG